MTASLYQFPDKLYPDMPIPTPTTSDGGKRNMYLLIGPPFTGKSTAAGTFPSPIFLDFDHKAPAGAVTYPFWDGKFCDQYAKRLNPNHPPNQRDALVNFLKQHVVTSKPDDRLPVESTLILDSLTFVEAAFHIQTEQCETIPLGRSGKPDDFFVWGKKLDYFDAIMAILKTWPGSVIVVVHEVDERGESGAVTGRIKPLLSGSYKDKLAANFTCMFGSRIIVTGKGPTETRQFVWDVLPSNKFPYNNTLGIKTPTIPAGYSSLAPYIKA